MFTRFNPNRLGYEAQRLYGGGTIYGPGFNALVSFCRNAIYNISLHDLTEIADQVSTAPRVTVSNI